MPTPLPESEPSADLSAVNGDEIGKSSVSGAWFGGLRGAQLGHFCEGFECFSVAQVSWISGGNGLTSIAQYVRPHFLNVIYR